ncbi:sugar phosphate isomerase/epimerase family protein [Pedobacter sp. JCM 36344]|uniref:sugar phosphate isomerase/epimerase family protein n=1 Tax=Pedobacter sp. JCM 36344 TaxID=3374280 RepID=UPI0039781B31
MNTRKSFLKTGIIGVAATIASKLSTFSAQNTVINIDNGSLRLGMAGYSFLNFKLDKSLEMMTKLDIRYLCIKDFHLPYMSTDTEIADFQSKLKVANVIGYAVGPIYTKTKTEIDKAFEYAKRVGVNMIIGIPLHADLPYVEKKVKESNIKFAIHNHGPEDELYPTVESIYRHILGLDPRIGICFDIGHDTRAGKNISLDMQKYHKRIFDMHLKNVTAPSNTGTTCELGRGIIDIPAFFKVLKKLNYTGSCSLEYEKDMKDPIAGIAESVGYFRGVCDALSQ